MEEKKRKKKKKRSKAKWIGRESKKAKTWLVNKYYAYYSEIITTLLFI